MKRAAPLWNPSKRGSVNAAGTQNNNELTILYIEVNNVVNIYIDNNRWSRLHRVESAGSCRRSIHNFRPETELSEEASLSANQSSEEVEGELMKHGYVVRQERGRRNS